MVTGHSDDNASDGNKARPCDSAPNKKGTRAGSLFCLAERESPRTEFNELIYNAFICYADFTHHSTQRFDGITGLRTLFEIITPCSAARPDGRPLAEVLDYAGSNRQW
jgi:hypothetical protein